MDDSQTVVAAATETPEIDLNEVGRRIDLLGQQLDWLCENMQSLFSFVNQMGQSGGGIRGLMHALKNGAPQLDSQPVEEANKVGNND